MNEMTFSFDIDKGELYGITDAKIFVLGVEIGLLYQAGLDGKLSAKIDPEMPIHSENVERVEKLIERFNLPAIVEPTDKTEWCVLRMLDGEK